MGAVLGLPQTWQRARAMVSFPYSTTLGLHSAKGISCGSEHQAGRAAIYRVVSATSLSTVFKQRCFRWSTICNAGIHAATR